MSTVSNKAEQLMASEGIDFSLEGLKAKYDELQVNGNESRDVLHFGNLEEYVKDCLVGYMEQAIQQLESGKVRLESCAEVGMLVRGIYQICSLAINGESDLVKDERGYRPVGAAIAMGEVGEWSVISTLEALGIELNEDERERKTNSAL